MASHRRGTESDETIAVSGGNMTQLEFWMLFGLIVIGIFGIGKRIGEAADSITRKMDDLKSELKDIKSKLDRP